MTVLVVLLVILLLVYLYLIMPNKQKRDFSKLVTFYYAHRGLHDNKTDAPENSMKAFKLAVDNNYGIELDVQITKDDVPVVFHDATLKRVCGVEGKVVDYTYEELKQFCLCESDEIIPLFEDVLKLVDGKTPLIVEYKSEDFNMHLCDVIHPLLAKYHGDYVIESFNPVVVSWYRKNYPEVIRGQLSMRFFKDNGDAFNWKYFAIEHLLTNVIARPDFVAYDYRGRSSLGFRLNKVLGAMPVTWTIKSQEVLDEVRKDFKMYIFEQFKAK